MFKLVPRGVRMSKFNMSPECANLLRNIQSQINEIRTETRSFMDQKNKQLLDLECQLSKLIHDGGQGSFKRSLHDDVNVSGKKVKTEDVEEENKVKLAASNNLDKMNFKIENDYYQVFTDGACPNNGKVGATAGIGVWWNHGHQLNIARRVVGAKQTNNVAEIQAICFALTQAKDAGIKRVQVNTDSQFVINSVTQWMEGWKRKGWKTSTGQDVKNKDDFLELDRIISEAKRGGVDIKWNHVKGHANIEGNEQADRLAVLGAQMKN